MIQLIVGYDIWFYISHILLHTKYLWKYHQIHHSRTDLTFMDAYYSHIFEGIFQSIGILLPLVISWTWTWTWTWPWVWIELAMAVIFVNLRGMARHEPRVIWLVGDYHLMHHKYPNTNYGEPWLDRLFGTQRASPDPAS
jgi:sterol desaturase/sphingolipid hydroxylase (fatty acid hydroxylase superfamily)